MYFRENKTFGEKYFFDQKSEFLIKKNQHSRNFDQNPRFLVGQGVVWMCGGLDLARVLCIDVSIRFCWDLR